MKKIILMILLTFALLLSSSINVSADLGPKPDVEITISNLEQGDYIIAIGMEQPYYGPHGAFDPNEEYYGDDKDHLLLIYNNVDIPDGWYLSDICQYYEDNNELVIHSGYMWPSDFIIIIYNVNTNDYYITSKTSRYAFHSYFSFDMNDYNGGYIELKNSYNYGKEILEFFIRLILTLVIEMLLALAFRFNKKSFIIILIVNIVTQIGLNIALNIINFNYGRQARYFVSYVFIEIIITIVESTIYQIFCKRGKNETKDWIIPYGIIANFVSFMAGIVIWLAW